MVEKKICPKCNQFMFVKPIGDSKFKKNWECPWCDYKEEISTKPDNISPADIANHMGCRMGVNGKCIQKGFEITEDEIWKCYNFHIKDQLTAIERNEFNLIQKKHWFIAVCRWCRFFEEKR